MELWSQLMLGLSRNQRNLEGAKNTLLEYQKYVTKSSYFQEKYRHYVTGKKTLL